MDVLPITFFVPRFFRIAFVFKLPFQQLGKLLHIAAGVILFQNAQ